MLDVKIVTAKIMIPVSRIRTCDQIFNVSLGEGFSGMRFFG
jgi:hypothetical protein